MAGDMCGRGVCMADTMRYGQQVGGTHPTGMHSCFKVCFGISYFNKNVHLLFPHQHANCLFLLLSNVYVYNVCNVYNVYEVIYCHVR